MRRAHIHRCGVDFALVCEEEGRYGRKKREVKRWGSDVKEKYKTVVKLQTGEKKERKREAKNKNKKRIDVKKITRGILLPFFSLKKRVILCPFLILLLFWSLSSFPRSNIIHTRSPNVHQSPRSEKNKNTRK